MIYNSVSKFSNCCRFSFMFQISDSVSDYRFSFMFQIFDHVSDSVSDYRFSIMFQIFVIRVRFKALKEWSVIPVFCC